MLIKSSLMGLTALIIGHSSNAGTEVTYGNKVPVNVYKKYDVVAYADKASRFRMVSVRPTKVASALVTVPGTCYSSDDFCGDQVRSVDHVDVIQVVVRYDTGNASSYDDGGSAVGDILINFALTDFNQSEIEQIKSTKGKLMGYNTKRNRQLAEAMFSFHLSEVNVIKEVIDYARSKLCDGWDPDANPYQNHNCREEIVTKLVRAPDIMVTVRKN